MHRTKVLILTSDKTLENQLHGFLSGYPDRYTIFHQTEFSTNIATYDVALIDENIIDKNPGKFLAKFTVEVNPTSLIYLTESLDHPEEFSAVKSLAADYLYKTQLTGSGLHNCIKYALESKSLRREIEKQRNRYESLFHNAIDAAFFLSPDWKIENANQAFLNLFGLTPLLIQKLDFQTLINDIDDYNELKRDFAAGENINLESEIKFNRRDKKSIFLGHLKISILKEAPTDSEDSEEVIVGFHGTINNISYKKRLRTIKESSDRIAMTYRLARTLAHEIRNPLTNITLSVNQLEDEVHKSEDMELYLGIIERSTKRIDTLIERLLKSSEQKSLKFSKSNMMETINLAIERAKDRAKLLDIKLISDLENESILYYYDSEKLQLAISNLITNALESFDKSPRQVIIGQYIEDNYICIYVEDTGIGMTENEKKTIFDPFFTKKKSGLGLGLTDTMAIISEHHGQIEVDSEPGLGTTFTILLPQTQKKLPTSN